MSSDKLIATNSYQYMIRNSDINISVLPLIHRYIV